MTLSIVDNLKVVQITDTDSERRDGSFADIILKFIFNFKESCSVSNAGKAVFSGIFVCDRKSVQLLVFFPDLFITVFNAQDKVRLVRRPSDGHPGVFRLTAVDTHSVIFNKLSAIFKLCDEVVFVKEQFEPLPVFRIDNLIRIVLCGSEKVFSLFRDLKFSIELVSGEFNVVGRTGIDIVDHVIMRCQTLCDLRKRRALQL